MPSPPRPVGPVHLADRFAPLDAELIALLRGCIRRSISSSARCRIGIATSPPNLGPSYTSPSREPREAVTIEGDQALGSVVLGALAVMA
jgi:hypothetical protein